MDLFKDWQTLEETAFNQAPIHKEKIMQSLQIQSQDILGKLDKRLRAKLYWGIGFVLVCGILLCLSIGSQTLITAVGVLLLIFILLMGATGLQVASLRKQKDQSSSLLNRLHVYHRCVVGVMRLENIMALLLVPVAAVAGQIAGYYLGDGGQLSIEAIFNDSTFLKVALVMVLVMTPLGVWLTNRLNNIAFGGLVKQIEQHIKEIEAI